MQPASDRPGELFAAFSRVNEYAFTNERLLSCPNLSKAPNYGQVLRHYLLRLPYRPLRPADWIRIGLRYLASNGGHLLFLLCGALFIRLLKWRTPPELLQPSPQSEDKALFIIDTFAVLPKIATDNFFQDMYLPGLEQEAAKSGKQVFRLYRLYGSRNLRVLWHTFKALAATGGGFTELHLFRASDWLRLCRHALVYPFALRRLIRSLGRFSADSPEHALREALLHTAGQCIVIGEGRRLAGLRLGLLLASHPLSPGTQVVSWHENQTVNKAFHRGLALAETRTGRHVPTTGAQLFIWPDTLLNVHPDDKEIALGLVPDRILVNGPHFLPENSRQKYAVGPSLRYGGLFSTLPTPTCYSSNSLLVLLSYHPEEVRRVLDLVLPLALHGRDVIYKFHPATQPAHYTAWLPPLPRYASGSVKSAIQNAGAVIGSGSGALAEAVALGIPVLTVEDPSDIPGLALNFLPAYGKGFLWESVRNSMHIESALQTLAKRAAATGSAIRAAEVQAFRDLLFTEPTPERIRKSFRL